jgi:hypothetical protein
LAVELNPDYDMPKHHGNESGESTQPSAAGQLTAHIHFEKVWPSGASDRNKIARIGGS